jgi:dTDP-4-amino-4,6-dideoxy-D-galactose acyltransferase
MADNVFVVKENDVIVGMIMLKIEGATGHLNLLAVAPEMQGRGYGKALINTCEKALFDKNIFNIELPTQVDNLPACKFYEKYGFKVKTITNIYHFWL